LAAELTQNQSPHKNASHHISTTTIPQKIEQEEDWDADIEAAHKAGLVVQTTPVLKPFETCLIGTSMIKHIRPVDLFKKKKCFYKSISGGSIKHVDAFLRTKEGYFDNCETFVITCGSNDCDSTKKINETVAAYFELCWYLHQKYPNAHLVLNTLVPRQTTRYTTPEEFEKRRVLFNQFLVSSINSLIWNAKIVLHPKFEDPELLATMLSDGVHLSVDHGVAVYVAEISSVLNELKADPNLHPIS
jgi:hypothetical protein